MYRDELFGIKFVILLHTLQAYALMVGGWVMNSTGYVLQIANKDDKYKQQFLAPSYLCWMLAMFTATTGLFFNALRAPRD